MFIEPGLTWSTGRGVVWVAMPVAFYVNRKPDSCTGIDGDATFPRFIFLAGYQFRFDAARARTPVTD